MTPVRPPIYNLKQLLNDLQRLTGLAWQVCRHTPQVVAVSRCGRFTYSVETEPIDKYTALVELTPLVRRASLAECARAINRHQADRSQ